MTSTRGSEDLALYHLHKGARCPYLQWCVTILKKHWAYRQTFSGSPIALALVMSSAPDNLEPFTLGKLLLPRPQLEYDCKSTTQFQGYPDDASVSGPVSSIYSSSLRQVHLGCRYSATHDWIPSVFCPGPAPTTWSAIGVHVMISDLALFNFLLLYDMASEVSPTWLTPVYLWFIQVAVTWLHLSLTDWTTSPLIDDSLLARYCDSVLGGYTCTFLLFYLGI